MDAVPNDEPTLRAQRDQALACLLLSATVALALILSNFGPQPTDLQYARAATQQHRELLQQHRQILAENLAVLAANKADLARLQSAGPTKP